MALFTVKVGAPTGVAAFVTVTVILWFLTSSSVMLKRPSLLNWNVYVSPGFRIGAVKGAFFEAGWWFFVSEFVHVIESPTAIVIELGRSRRS